MTKIKKALAQLDPANDQHWTSNGSPLMDTMKELTGDPTLTRKAITDADPQFNRHIAQELAGQRSLGLGEVIEDIGEAIVDPIDTADKIIGAVEDVADAIVNPEEIIGAIEDAGEEVFGPTDDEILAQPISVAFATEDSLRQYRDAISRHTRNLSKQVSQAKDALKQWVVVEAQADQRLRMIERAKPNADTSSVQAYLKGQRKSRNERAKRAQRFIEAGTSAEDVAKELSGKAPIDAALNRRKASPGTTRPAPRIPVRR